MKVFQIRVGPMENFAYVLEDEDTKTGMVIDSGWEIEPILNLVASEKMEVAYVCATHGHFDHVKTIARLAHELGAQTVAYEGSEINPKVRVHDRDYLRVGDSKVIVIHTPGHTRDSVCYYDKEHLFTGDTLVIEAWGRTDLPGGSDEVMFESLHETIMALPETTIIYPGHDYGSVPFRTLGEEVKKNPSLKARTLQEFRALTQG
jgi:hydroxyacylglutathione hydrolase